MGVKQSKQSVDISSTPKKAGPEGDINNGKTAAEVKEVEATKVNGVEGEVKANGEATPANGDAKAADAEPEKKEGEEEAPAAEETKEAEGEGNFIRHLCESVSA